MSPGHRAYCKIHTSSFLWAYVVDEDEARTWGSLEVAGVELPYRARCRYLAAVKAHVGKLGMHALRRSVHDLEYEAQIFVLKWS